MSQPVEQGSRAYEWAAGIVTTATVAGVLHWLLAVPAAIYYACKCWDWWERRRAMKAKKG